MENRGANSPVIINIGSRPVAAEQSSAAAALLDLLQDAQQTIDIDRLDQVLVETGLLRTASIVVLTPPGERNQKHAAMLGIRPQAPRHFVPVDIRKPDVDQGHVRETGRGQSDRLMAIACDHGLIANQLEQLGQAIADIGVVVDDHHTAVAFQSGHFFRFVHHFGFCYPGTGRQAHNDARTLVLPAAEALHVAPVH